ncbi:hypothetical protein BDF21DRAFT_410107 [Thamnidium elegans]|nr:hypothetical protein BDF21DRAFT_410107 [Thamnidium elegans]
MKLVEKSKFLVVNIFFIHVIIAVCIHYDKFQKLTYTIRYSFYFGTPLMYKLPHPLFFFHLKKPKPK